MTNQLSTPSGNAPRKSILSALAARLNADPKQLLETLKETAFKGANYAELMALCAVANEYHLNPFLREIYAFPAKGGGIVPIVSVDGWIKIINAHPQLDGLDHKFHGEGDDRACTFTIYRKDRSHPIHITEYLVECQRNTEPWRIAPRRMLRHKALIQCARVAFGFSGIHDEDEGTSYAETVDEEPRKRIDPFAGANNPAPQEEPEPEKKPKPEPQPTPEDNPYADDDSLM